MTLTIALLKKWYAEFSKIVFDNDMPVVNFKLTNGQHSLGRATRRRKNGVDVYGINISLYWDRNEEQYRNCLLHEMCHIWCYYHGYREEHHTGPKWIEITNKAYRLTGMRITRCEDIRSWQRAGGNQPFIIVDINYGDHHFIIKTTKNIIAKEIYRLESDACKQVHPHNIYISDADVFNLMATTRSLNRGYRYDNWRYEKEMKPLLSKAISVENPRHILWGQYDFLGIK